MRNVSVPVVVRVGQEVAVLSLGGRNLPCKHGCGVLVGYGVLGCLHFLVLDEFIMPLCIVDIRVIASMIR